MNFLIVDDNRIELMILKDLLSSEGHSVKDCKNGEEAFQTAAASLPDVIVSDILMPVMDGYSLCKSIRSDIRTADIPFVFYTATYTKDEDEELALQMGADGFFRKPMEWGKFFTVVTSLVDQIQKNGRAQKQRSIRKEDDLYKLYSERLIKKLEDKVFELENEVRWRKEVEAKLKRSRQQSRDLSNYLQTSIENERARIARGIHDDLGQLLTAANIDISWIRDNLPGKNEKLHEKTKLALNLIKKAIQSVRQIVSDLRPTLLDELGLAAAIEWQASDFQSRTGINHSVLIDLDENVTINSELSITVFRICQEALTNVARHANATEVLVKILGKNNSLQLTVIDNGTGISQKEITDPQSYGLMGMRERASACGGSIEISKAAVGGTKIFLTVPVGNNTSV